MAGAVGNLAANARPVRVRIPFIHSLTLFTHKLIHPLSLGSNPGDPEAALAKGSSPRPARATAPVEQVAVGPLGAQISRGSVREAQLGVPFPRQCWCNKVQ